MAPQSTVGSRKQSIVGPAREIKDDETTQRTTPTFSDGPAPPKRAQSDGFKRVPAKPAANIACNCPERSRVGGAAPGPHHLTICPAFEAAPTSNTASVLANADRARCTCAEDTDEPGPDHGRRCPMFREPKPDTSEMLPGHHRCNCDHDSFERGPDHAKNCPAYLAPVADTSPPKPDQRRASEDLPRVVERVGDIEIEDGIPPPKIGRATKFPFASLTEVTRSFWVEGDISKSTVNNARKRTGWGFSMAPAKKNGKDGTRVWRIK